MTRLTTIWTLTALALLLVPTSSALAQFPGDEEPEGVAFYYKIQKRGGGGRFIGWFLDINAKAKASKGVASNLTTTWFSKPDTTTWEIRPAGEFNGVDAVYILNQGDSKFAGWYLGINEETGDPTLNDDAESSTTKWLVRWVGRDGKYDLYQFRNAGLTRFTGAHVAMTVEDVDHSEGSARNIYITPEPRDAGTFWTLKRFVPPLDEEAAAAPQPRY